MRKEVWLEKGVPRWTIHCYRFILMTKMNNDKGLLSQGLKNARRHEAGGFFHRKLFIIR